MKHLGKTNRHLYKIKLLASAMMLHDGDAVSVEVCRVVVEIKHSLFHLVTVCAKHLFYILNL
jgi:hypothetical protein